MILKRLNMTFRIKAAFVLSVFFLTFNLVEGQKKVLSYLEVDADNERDEYRVERIYKVFDIDTTKSYHILQTLYKQDTTVLVIDKTSIQIEEIELKENHQYSFRTYRLYDTNYSTQYLMCHYVENKRVWCAEEFYKKNIDIHFTDFLGDEVFEDPLYPIDENLNVSKIKQKRKYKIQSIDSTKRHYIYKAKIKKDSVFLVVSKKSRQLKNKLEVNKVYRVSTYKIDDITDMDSLLCHYVDRKWLWCFADGLQLHFTDGMGNGLYEKAKDY